jgi:GNAT superfamily N-acetyltransferase
MADVPVLAKLLGELGYAVAPDMLSTRVERLLSSAANRVLVATRAQASLESGESTESGASRASGSTPIGLLSLHLTPVIHDARDLAMIMALVIAEGARGEGVGRALIDSAAAIAREHGAGRLFVTTHLRRAGAHAFYERLGFEFTGRRYVKVLD